MLARAGNWSNNIPPPLPLMVTPSVPPPGAVGFPYNFLISATGGVPPFNFSLPAGSSALPAGLNLTTTNNQGVISGTPTAAGTTSNNMVQGADSQLPALTAPATHSISINPSPRF